MTNEPRRLLDRLVDASVAIFLAALALNGAVMLLSRVWAELVILASVMGAIVVLLVLWRAWRGWGSRW